MLIMAVWISSTQFGSITINGKKYEHDVIVTWGGKVKPVDMELRHVFGERELSQVLLERPEIIVVGLGQYSLMEISPGVFMFADRKKLKIMERPTPQAVKEFNELAREGKKVVAYFHLTC